MVILLLILKDCSQLGIWNEKQIIRSVICWFRVLLHFYRKIQKCALWSQQFYISDLRYINGFDAKHIFLEKDNHFLYFLLNVAIRLGKRNNPVSKELFEKISFWKKLNIIFKFWAGKWFIVSGRVCDNCKGIQRFEVYENLKIEDLNDYTETWVDGWFLRPLYFIQTLKRGV